MKNTTGTVKHFKKCKRLHSIIWQNDSLGWLNSWEGQCPTEKYELVKRELRYGRNIKVYTIVSSFVGWFTVLVLLATLFFWKTMTYSVANSLIAAFIVSFTVVSGFTGATSYWLDKFLNGWLAAIWDTAEFFTDVIKLDRIVCGQVYPKYQYELESGYSSSLETLTRSGLEGIHGQVPEGVRLQCEKWLRLQIKGVLVEERLENPTDKALGLPLRIREHKERKESISQGFELFKRFAILSKDARLDLYYKEVQTTLELEKKDGARA